MFPNQNLKHTKTVTFKKKIPEITKNQPSSLNNFRSKTVFPISSLKCKCETTPIKSNFGSFNTKSSTIEITNSRSNSINAIRRHSRKKDDYIQALYDKYDNLNKKLHYPCQTTKLVRKEHYLTPMPHMRKYSNNNLQQRLMSNAICNAIVLRRLEYNKHIRSIRINQKKKNLIPKKEIIEKKIPKFFPQKIYDISKVIFIQKMCKGYLARNVYHNIVRMKGRICLVETFCLLLKKDIFRARKRRVFTIFKKLFYEPFSVENELNFKDKLRILVTNNYYHFIQRRNSATSKEK